LRLPTTRWSLAAAAAALAVTLPVSAKESAPEADGETPAAYVERALDLLQQFHMNREQVDWDALRDAVMVLSDHAQTPLETHSALRAAVVAMGDNHGYLYVPQPRLQSGGQPGKEAAAPPMPEGEALDGDIGYLMLPRLTTVGGNEEVGTQYRELLVQTLERLDSSARCGWVVDLRKNGGGNMWPMLNGLDPLLGEGPFGYFVGIEGRAAWVRSEDGISSRGGGEVDTGEAKYALGNAATPVAVLFGPRTASTGEMVAVAFAGRASSRSFGARSANYTTAVRPFELSDGAVLGVTSSKVAYRDGTLIEGPLVPDETVEGDALEAALEWLRGQCAVSGTSEK